MSLLLVPLELDEANRVVAAWHRHHEPATGHRYSIGAVDEDGIVHGAAIVGRAVSRHYSPRYVAEVTRLVSDGTHNVCSLLYSAAAREWRDRGGVRIQTYTLEDELGTSLDASGWFCEGLNDGGEWTRMVRPRKTTQPACRKWRWAKIVNPPRPAALVIPKADADHPQLFTEDAA